MYCSVIHCVIAGISEGLEFSIQGFVAGSGWGHWTEGIGALDSSEVRDMQDTGLLLRNSH